MGHAYSFCGKNNTQVRRIITGSNAVICNECVETCNEIVTKNETSNTTDITDHDTSIKCSFCGKYRFEILKVVSGSGIFICNECVDVCNVIMAEIQESK